MTNDPLDDQEQLGEWQPEDEFWKGVATRMTPDQALTRLDTHGKFLFSTVSIIGTLLAGFGVFNPVALELLRNPLLLVPIGLACLSLVSAMMGLTPRTDRVNRQDVESIRGYWNRLLLWRGRYITIASWLFALSLFSIPLAFLFRSPMPQMAVSSTTSLHLAGRPEKSGLAGRVDLDGVPAAAIIETEIHGFRETKQGQQPTLLFRDVKRNVTGKVSVMAEIEGLRCYRWFTIQTRVLAENVTVHEDRAEVHR